jgi:hypothetical protein
MNKKDILSRMYPTILEELSDKSFKWIKSKEILKKATDIGFQTIQIFTDPVGFGFEIKVTIGLRINKVEDIINVFREMNPDYKKDTETHVVSAGMLRGDIHFRWEVHNEEQFQHSIIEIINFLNTEGLYYLNRYQNIDELEKLYNNLPTDATVKIKVPFAKAFTGLTLAKLVSRSDFEELVNRYEVEMKRANDEMYFPDRFYELVNFLRKM